MYYFWYRSIQLSFSCCFRSVGSKIFSLWSKLHFKTNKTDVAYTILAFKSFTLPGCFGKCFMSSRLNNHPGLFEDTYPRQDIRIMICVLNVIFIWVEYLFSSVIHHLTRRNLSSSLSHILSCDVCSWIFDTSQTSMVSSSW